MNSTRPPSQRPSTQQRPATQQRPTSQRAATRAGTQRHATVAAGAHATRPWSRPIVLAACGLAVVLLGGLVALLRPSSHGPVEEAGPGAEEAAVEAPLDVSASPEPSLEAAASRPHAGSAVAVLVQADAAYESGDLGAARDLYLEILLTGGDFGGDEAGEVRRWAHGRLALATARLARAPGARLLDEPVFRFREGAK